MADDFIPLEGLVKLAPESHEKYLEGSPSAEQPMLDENHLMGKLESLELRGGLENRIADPDGFIDRIVIEVFRHEEEPDNLVLMRQVKLTLSKLEGEAGTIEVADQWEDSAFTITDIATPTSPVCLARALDLIEVHLNSFPMVVNGEVDGIEDDGPSL